MTVSITRHLGDRLPAWAAPAAVGAVATSAVGAVAAIDPATRAGWSPGCPFRMLTGFDCPGCGGTRALYALTQGDIVLALDHNLITVVLLPVLLGVWATWFARRVRHGRAGRAPIPTAAVSMGIAVTLSAFWVVRNLPWWPFSWLGSSPAG